MLPSLPGRDWYTQYETAPYPPEERQNMTGHRFDLKDLERRMHGAFTVLKSEFGGLRTGRASASLLDPITVDAYGTPMPLNQVANISAPESRMLLVQVWDKSQVHAVEKAIRESDLGLNPMIDGQTLRIPIPELNEERRQELTKVAAKYTEQARVAVRNVRRDGMEQLKHMEKDGEIGKDLHHDHGEEVQKLTDKTIKEIDDALHQKEQEIMQV
jgi:ribosome recycling factor